MRPQKKPTKPDAPRIWVRIDKAHVAKVLEARRALGYGEGVRG
jgi:hypothetical protein